MKKLDVIKILIVFAMIYGFAIQTHAQTADRKWAVGAYSSLFEYHGDFGNEFFSFDFDQIEVGGGLYLSKYLNPSFDLVGRFSVGEINYIGDEDSKFEGKHFHTTMFTSDLNLVYKFANGYLIPEDFILNPFVTAGVGAFYAAAEGKTTDWNKFYSKKRVRTPLDLYAGLGFKIRATKALSVVLQSGCHFPMSDRIDGETAGGGISDQVFEHSLGLEMSIANPQDSDGDGIPDKRDRCPDTPEGVDVDRHGCPLDNDQDGIPNYQDSCPDVAGLIRFNGCPDTDGDGVMDKEDECPNEKGMKRFKGCPDTDKDAIGDRDDECPEDPGPLEMNGCPCNYKPMENCGDDDNDGVTNALDKCPDTPAGYQVDKDGCPLDDDNDGVPNQMDKCPDVPGIHDGCPEAGGAIINPENVEFDTGKATLRPKSNETLNQIAQILLDRPTLNLEISGYTDSDGSDAFNLDLSKRRAAACRDYLVQKGVSINRIKANGYGENNPVATNSTREGKQRNRRTEFKIAIK